MNCQTAGSGKTGAWKRKNAVHMTAIAVEAEEDTLPDGWVWADRPDLLYRYAVPNAFLAFEGRVLERLSFPGEEEYQ